MAPYTLQNAVFTISRGNIKKASNTKAGFRIENRLLYLIKILYF